MYCPSCGQYETHGQFCSHCGTELTHTTEHNDHMQEARTSSASTHDDSTTDPPEELWEKIKRTGNDFGHFLAILIKHPNKAKKANQTDMAFSLTIIILFAVFVTGSYTHILNTIPGGFYHHISFMNGVILPFIMIVLLEYLIAGLTFACTRLSKQPPSFAVVTAKYGAYLVPFVLIFGAGLMLFLSGIPVLAGILTLISILGLLLVAPALIIMDHPPQAFDRVYVLIGLFIVIMLIVNLFVRSFLASIFSGLMKAYFGGF